MKKKSKIKQVLESKPKAWCIQQMTFGLTLWEQREMLQFVKKYGKTFGKDS